MLDKKLKIILLSLIFTTACANSNNESEIRAEDTVIVDETVTVVDDVNDYSEDAQMQNNYANVDDSEEDKLPTVVNDYFFVGTEKVYTYDVTEFLYEDIEEVSLDVSIEESFEYGDVYSIVIDYEECVGRYFYGVDRFELGLFLVTEDSIYWLREVVDEDITEELFIEKGILVCASEDSDENYDGEQRTLINDGNVCTYTSYNTLTESGMYYEFQWTKGEGLTYYRSGYGAEGDPIEICR